MLAAAAFDDANAGTGKAVSMSGITFDVVDSNGKSIYGYDPLSA